MNAEETLEKSVVCFVFLNFKVLFLVLLFGRRPLVMLKLIKLFIIFIKDFFFFFFDAAHLMMQSDRHTVFLKEQLAWIYPKTAKIILLCDLK